MKCDRQVASNHIQAFLKQNKKLLYSEKDNGELAQLYLNHSEDITHQTLYKGEKMDSNLVVGAATQALQTYAKTSRTLNWISLF